ncbi:ATP-binding protein [Spirosoma sp. SC4-14]|uniref:ATP-binding protein n=1 Tax=Spirosoma sp. SC4-14 TaxID=3128900 RepID=UPI0030CD49A4
MLFHQPDTLALSQLLDALPDAVVWMRAVRNETNEIVNFQIEYSNQEAQERTQGQYQVSVGTLVLGNNEHDKPYMEQAFQTMCGIMETGQAQEHSFFNSSLNGWYQNRRSKLDDGILSITRDISRWKAVDDERQTQNELLQAILDSSINNIFVYEAIRDLAGQICDFRVRLVNPVGRQDVMHRYGKDPLVNTLLQFRPDSRVSGQFNLFCQVVETGQPIWAQHYFADIQAWYDTSITKLGDGCVVTGIDVTQQKLDLLNYKHQSDLIHNVLNGISNGIMAFEAIRNTDGQIEDLRISTANQIGANVAGKPIDQLVGRRALIDFPGIKPAGLFDLFVETIETGAELQKELFYKADNLDVRVHVSTSKLGDGLVVTYNDITESRRIQQEIVETADLLQTVINNSPAALVLYEPMLDNENEIIDFRYKLVNPIAAEATGRALDYMQDNTLFSMFPMAAQQGFFDRLIHVLQTGEPLQYEQHFSGDDVDLWADITMVKQGDDVLTVFQYITELKRTQQELERSRAELQTVIDRSQTGIFLFSPVRNEAGEIIDFRFRVANRQAVGLAGGDVDTFIGSLGSSVFPEYKNNGLFDTYYRVHQTAESCRFEFNANLRGTELWLDIMATKMGDEVLVTFSDFTALKQLQQQLEASVIELQRSNRNLEQFAYIASHDLQEPLRKIQAFGDIIQVQYASVVGESGADMIRRMQVAAARMQVLIKDVLAYSRVSAKREAHKTVDLNIIVTEVLVDLETSINDAQAIIQIDRLPIIAGDALQMQQLFQNLISNSLKFSHPDRTLGISIKTRLVRANEIEMAVMPSDAQRDFHLIEFADNGIGFEPHHADRIFQVFQRLHGRSEYQGTGIGLAIVQKVVENHQGYIMATGKPELGATFRILLPVR